MYITAKEFYTHIYILENMDSVKNLLKYRYIYFTSVSIFELLQMKLKIQFSSL